MPNLQQKKAFCPLPPVERGKFMRLSGDPKGVNILYCHDKSVIIRDMKDPSKVDIYTEHAAKVTVARYSPSGFYIASGDCSGKIRIWDTVNKEHILKAEYPVLGGPIKDLDWSPDSQKIVVCGEGREKYAHVFSIDTGTSVGTLDGHSKSVNACTFRPCRPFRIATASEDMTVVFYTGPPFKFEKTKKLHTNFVNTVRFSPDGKCFISGGADGKLYKYDGVEGNESEKVEIGEPKAHKGQIYEICFNKEGTKILTASGDKTAKIFSVEKGECLMTFTNDIKDWQGMNLGCLWQGDEIITINCYGHLTYHDEGDPDTPKRIVKGHCKPITSLALNSDRTILFSGGQEGIICWDIASGNSTEMGGQGHTSEVTDMITDGDNLISVGVDDFLRFSNICEQQFGGEPVKMDSQPKAVDALNGVIVVACVQHVIVLQGNRKLSSRPTPSEAWCVSIHPSGSKVAIGYKDNNVRIYALQNGSLEEEKVVGLPGEVKCLAYSPDGTHLAAGAERTVVLLSTSNYDTLNKGEPHTARVRCLAWSPDSSQFASAGLDSKLVLWNNLKASPIQKKPEIKAHAMSHANQLVWVDSHTIMTVGQDSSVKSFSICD